jgi:hypothetical protein
MLAASHHITFHLQMVADDAAARKLLEEDRQADAIIKEFTKGTPACLFPDSDVNQLAMQNMMSPDRRVTRSFATKGKEKKKWCLAIRRRMLLGMHCLCLTIPSGLRCSRSILHCNPPTCLG